MGKKVLVVGQGGREHALVWKLAQSPQVDKIYAAPGNPGMAQLAQCVNIAASDVPGLLDFAQQEKIDLTVVGPEDPLMNGIVDAFKEKDLKIFGPTAKAAQLEGSKVFSKELMRKYNIPTADYQVFDDPEAAAAFACSFTDRGQPVVIKADGLAAGKGVIIAASSQEACQAVNEIMREKVFGEAGRRIVVEEFLQGEEVSVFALADGHRAVFLVAAQDHKRVFDNDLGPNTGGMGAYTHPPIYTQAVHEQVDREILQATVQAMAKENCPYQGVLYAGLMITPNGPKVLEFNARFGDPETQVIMPVIEGDLLPLLEAAAGGDLSSVEIKVRPDYCVCVVLASGGYPGTYQKGYPITGLENLAESTLVFHAGTALQNGQLVTGGGRVMALVTQADSMENALAAVYTQIKHVDFTGMHYRTDIGRRALNRGR
ncbi:MAG TPA: phosphoribosylamine--glycine ligase [Syntrophomonadaceae bacterium]|nr:phosphoribosylamine--glycine ligase [Syntrophomonadaceae bacterium]HQE23949.1 phosphoribosylamine--glycine ligase [Syntrophomonadaceae bacterium]